MTTVHHWPDLDIPHTIEIPITLKILSYINVHGFMIAYHDTNILPVLFIAKSRPKLVIEGTMDRPFYLHTTI